MNSLSRSISAFAAARKAIPSDTPLQRLAYLRDQYHDPSNPTVAGLPNWYRQTQLRRIDELLMGKVGAA